jgi:hypothetical protein
MRGHPPRADHQVMTQPMPDLDIVVFGASGDLASRKVLPAVGAVAPQARLHVVGAGRSDLTGEPFRRLVGDTTGSADLAAGAEWVRLDYGDPGTYAALRPALRGDAAVYYLATPPNTFSPILSALASSGLAHRGDGSRVVLEKPLGRDEATAHELNQQLAALFDESQVYRIDHYLAKDTVQNLLACRFSNALFEAVWNRLYIESIEITAAEDLDVGRRAGYYDHYGAVRDMVQNHVLQILSLIAMDPPTTLNALDIRDAKTRLLRAVRPLDSSTAVRGQYEGYLDAGDVAPGSRRETYAAALVAIDNWRWQGVPIFVRTLHPDAARDPVPAARGGRAADRGQGAGPALRARARRPASRVRAPGPGPAPGRVRERLRRGAGGRPLGVPRTRRDRARLADRGSAAPVLGAGWEPAAVRTGHVGPGRGGCAGRGARRRSLDHVRRRAGTGRLSPSSGGRRSGPRGERAARPCSTGDPAPARRGLCLSRRCADDPMDQ